jgi:hypothetical protein
MFRAKPWSVWKSVLGTTHEPGRAETTGCQKVKASEQVSANSGQWQPGQSGNAGGRRKEKPYRDMLLKVLREEQDFDPKEPRTKLEAVVRAHVEKARAGDGTLIQAAADRLDGKVPQALIGSDDPDDAPLTIQHIELVAVPPEGGK